MYYADRFVLASHSESCGVRLILCTTLPPMSSYARATCTLSTPLPLYRTAPPELHHVTYIATICGLFNWCIKTTFSPFARYRWALKRHWATTQRNWGSMFNRQTPRSVQRGCEDIERSNTSQRERREVDASLAREGGNYFAMLEVSVQLRSKTEATQSQRKRPNEGFEQSFG